MSGKLITFEGIDGSGKSTQIDLLRSYLEAAGHKVLVVREPGGTELSEKIRDLLLAIESAGLDPRAELFLFSAARAQLVHELIRPALDDNKIVICDRYADSSIAYQGYGRELPLEQVITTQNLATGGLKPDLKILLDIAVPASFNRLENMDDDRMESSGQSFRSRVREGYLKLAHGSPGEWLVIDGSLEKGAIAQVIAEAIEERLLNE
ncbi:MAG: dTMP kinase [Candidatus Marinimicrobia bacterium]|nr:dTMP kinase [Candidatus Neomarinimicrobiota bacterium]